MLAEVALANCYSALRISDYYTIVLNIVIKNKHTIAQKLQLILFQMQCAQLKTLRYCVF